MKTKIVCYCGSLRFKEIFKKIKRNKITYTHIKHNTPETYYAMNVIEIIYINTYQVWGINLILFNHIIQVSHTK